MQRTDTITITDEAEILDAGYIAIAKTYGWTETVQDEKGEDIPNPQSAMDKAIDVTKKFWREVVVAYQSQQAAEMARLKAIEYVSSNINKTEVTLTSGE